MTQYADVLRRVKFVIAKTFDRTYNEISKNTDIYDDLGADSLDVVDLICKLDDEFFVDVDLKHIHISTVGEIARFIYNEVNKNASKI